ncbi:hypothetical protein UFOVP112_123 [uncultured Caudovirales phage]|uniref:Gp5/Type VI secretion system Vgr protein OB-fold domain-containing protein n=1 Tax=uncultured Caudovirales phage TaxID=2100421 RepID=A0A6J5L6G0_9CAUD|nr:hypothetical protein UFOVP112_123 [uncultured Caudovirales phage]
MATNRIRTSGSDPNAKAEGKRSGMTVDPGPYEAIVKGHVEGTRMGQLIVSIPDFSGASDYETGTDSGQIVVSYASPFYGSTFGTDSGQSPDGPATSGQSYGMWCVPPDIGNRVLVTFAAGDMNRGYWFACIYDSPSHHMVPGLARNIGGAENTNKPGEQVLPYVNSKSVLPVTEYNTNAKVSPTAFADLTNTPRYPHEVQTMALVKQGLDKDPIRGAISSSSMRESPSNVYGISTPGRKATKTNQIASEPQAVIYRTGGHQFVMDDGAEDGTDQLIRLRTSGGHQILMNDTEGILYIASASGAQWLEFSKNGAINVYGAAGFNLRSSGAINMHSDAGINMNAPSIKLNAGGSAKNPIGSVKITSSGSFSVSAIMTASIKADGALTLSAMGKASLEAGGALTMGALGITSLSSGAALKLAGAGVVNIDGSMLMLNCGGPSKPPTPIPALPVIPTSLPDTIFADGVGWQASGTLQSICTVVPSHEPWTRKSPTTSSGLGSILTG